MRKRRPARPMRKIDTLSVRIGTTRRVPVRAVVVRTPEPPLMLMSAPGATPGHDEIAETRAAGIACAAGPAAQPERQTELHAALVPVPSILAMRLVQGDRRWRRGIRLGRRHHGQRFVDWRWGDGGSTGLARRRGRSRGCVLAASRPSSSQEQHPRKSQFQNSGPSHGARGAAAREERGGGILDVFQRRTTKRTRPAAAYRVGSAELCSAKTSAGRYGNPARVSIMKTRSEF